jgi:hypothetical protein
MVRKSHGKNKKLFFLSFMEKMTIPIENVVIGKVPPCIYLFIDLPGVRGRMRPYSAIP